MKRFDNQSAESQVFQIGEKVGVVVEYDPVETVMELLA
jgi:hypothetical protein